MTSGNANSPVLSGEASAPTPFQSLLTKMEMDAEIDAGENNSSLIQGVEKILLSDDEDEMWVADDITQTGGRDLADVEMQVLRFLIRRSNDPEINTPFVDSKGRKMYLLVDSVKLADGTEFTWNTSAPLLVAKLFWLEEHGRLPYECVIKSTELAGGKAVLKLKPIPKRAVAGKK
jgi:hypothetical protein